MDALLTIIGGFLLFMLIAALIVIPIDMYMACHNIETTYEDTFEVVVTGLYVDGNQYKVAVSGQVNKVVTTTERIFAALSIGDAVVVKKTTIQSTYYDDVVKWSIVGGN